jgi:hypothetical protein
MPYSAQWQAMRILYQSRGLQTVFDCLLDGAEHGVNSYIKTAASYGLRGLIDTDEHSAAMLAQVGTSNADSLAVVFTSLIEACLQHSMLATFTSEVMKTGKDKRSGVSPDTADAMAVMLRQHMGASYGGLPEATWVSFVVTSVAHLCWQALAKYGDSGIANNMVYDMFQEEERAIKLAHRLDALAWHRLQDSMSPMLARELHREIRAYNRAHYAPVNPRSGHYRKRK